MFMDETYKGMLSYGKIVIGLQVVLFPLSLLFSPGIFILFIPIFGVIAMMLMVVMAYLKASQIDKKKCFKSSISLLLFQLALSVLMFVWVVYEIKRSFDIW